MPLLDEGADRGALERRDPADALGLAHLVDGLAARSCRGRPPSPAARCRSPSRSRLTCGHEGLAVGDIALVHRHRHRAAARIGEQAVVDLQQAASCRRGCSRAWPADRCCPRSSSRTGRRAPGRPRSDGARRASSGSCPGARAASPSPRTDRPRSASATPKVLGQRRGVPPARGGQLGVRGDDARGHHGQHQVALAARAWRRSARPSPRRCMVSATACTCPCARERLPTLELSR